MDPIPRVSRNGFEYYNDDFYVVIPPYNSHRPCTVSELRDPLNSPGSVSVNHKPAYWYRAQLPHYGLRPTDHKDMAFTRLLNALPGELKVPVHLVKLEDELRREWQRNMREMRKFTRKSSETAKFDMSGIDTKPSVSDCANEKRRKEQKPGIAARAMDSAFTPLARDSDSIGYSTGEYARSPAKAYQEERKQECKNPITTSGKLSSKRHDNSQDCRYEGATSQTRPGPTLSLGLLNGIYKIDAYGPDTRDSGMRLCLDGTSIRGEFQLGDMQGVFFMPKRPWSITRIDHDGSVF
ncbi:hypothetical protein BJX64DRAFT_249736 [Aspergillus heterothallicus]